MQVSSINLISLFVIIPIRFISLSTTGTPDIYIQPLSYQLLQHSHLGRYKSVDNNTALTLFTILTIFAWVSISIFLWIIPSPTPLSPRNCSSILCYCIHCTEIIGIFKLTLFVILVFKLTSFGRTVECFGTSSTSSKVNTPH